MIRLGIIGSNFGCSVLAPAFRRDPRCEIVALAGRDPARAAAAAAELRIPRGLGNWRDLVAVPDIDAVAVAVPPVLQPDVAGAAIARGKAVFLEKPLAADLAGARALRDAGAQAQVAMAVDFEFTALASWRLVRDLLGQGAVGALRHVMITWNVENYATRMRLKTWKTDAAQGGGALGNLVSHSLHYLEWFCGPVTGLSARLTGLPGETEPSETNAALAFSLASGAAGSLAMSCGSFLGTGHRLEFYGEDGTLLLVNTTTDYIRGFEVWHARRPAAALERIPTDDELDGLADPRIGPVSRLASAFLDAIEQGQPVTPGLAEGYRVQWLIARARQAHREGRWLAAAPETMNTESLA